MRAWVFIPLIALAACMDTSKDDDDDEDEDDESGLDDFGGGVGAGSGGGSGDGGSGGEGSGGEGSGSGGEGSGSGGGDGFDGTYNTLLVHYIVLDGAFEFPCETSAPSTISGVSFTGDAICDDTGILTWTVGWEGEVDSSGEISGEVFINVAEFGEAFVVPLEGETDGIGIGAVFEGAGDGITIGGQIYGDRAR
jgi:hypothetical protein